MDVLVHLRRNRRTQEVDQSKTDLIQSTGTKTEPTDPGRAAKFFGNRRVQKIAVGLAGAGLLIPIPLLAHHPGAEKTREPPPPATAAPHPEPTTTTTEPPAPPPTTPPAPVERPPLAPAFTNLSNVESTLSRPHPGIQYLRLTADGPHVVHIAEIDLRRDEFKTRVTHSNERNQTTSSFAASTGALVAINGDWFEYGSYQPNGLAIADGEVWSQDRAEWLFLACDVANNCLIDGVNTLATIDPAWKSAIGGNGAALVVNGQAQLSNEAFYATDRHPRSAVGLTGDGRMFLVVAEGRQGDAAGMTFNEMAQLLVDLGAVRGMMLDGGGSSTLVIDGQRVNDLPSGSGERSVGDHFAIVPAR